MTPGPISLTLLEKAATDNGFDLAGARRTARPTLNGWTCSMACCLPPNSTRPSTADS